MLVIRVEIPQVNILHNPDIVVPCSANRGGTSTVVAYSPSYLHGVVGQRCGIGYLRNM